MKIKKFVDLAVLYARAGNGGNGCCSFRREKYIPKGGPDGGDGGHGGHVILEADPDMTSLTHIFYQPHQRAGHGGHGKGKRLRGKNGEDRIVKIPCGTVVRDKETGVALGDIVEPAQRLVIARGGKGGLGNCHWTSSTHQAPREWTPGESGEEVALDLELRLVADAGLVGFPNAGKSSLLSTISDAHPKVGRYPFTTLNPIIGTLVFEDYSRLTIADIPGIIEGAHSGVGLGHAFLRHIERASIIIYVVDMAGVDNREPAGDFNNLRTELGLHQEDLLERPFLVVANKMDLPEAVDNLREFRETTGLDPVEVSAQTGEGIESLKESIFKVWQAFLATRHQ